MTTETNLPVPFTRTENILRVLRIICWAAFYGLMISGVSILISYINSIGNPEKAKNIYRSLDLSALYQFSFLHYSLAIAYMIILNFLKAGIAYSLAKSFSRVTAQSPFTASMARILEKISYVLLAMASIAFVHNIHSNWLNKVSDLTIERGALPDYLFTAGLVYVIAQLYKRGVEIQSENELTV